MIAILRYHLLPGLVLASRPGHSARSPLVNPRHVTCQLGRRSSVSLSHSHAIVRCAQAADAAGDAVAQLPATVNLAAVLTERSTQTLNAGLHIVPTPIGNLEDITLRAIRVLQQASTVLAEDTRHTRKLLVAYGIQTPLLSLHEHNEHSRVSQVMQQLEMGASLALVSDAGTPTISDPGSQVIRAAIAAGHRVIPLPGASAAVAALVASGLPADDFRFVGFLPPKSGARKKRLQELAEAPCTLIFYAPPHGIAAVLADAAEVLGADRQCVVARELTKLNEDFYRSTLADATSHYASSPVKGEITLLIAGLSASSGPPPDEAELIAVLRQLLQSGESASSAAKLAAAECSVPKKTVYSLAVRLAEGAKGAVAEKDTSAA